MNMDLSRIEADVARWASERPPQEIDPYSLIYEWDFADSSDWTAMVTFGISTAQYEWDFAADFAAEQFSQALKSVTLSFDLAVESMDAWAGWQQFYQQFEEQPDDPNHKPNRAERRHPRKPGNQLASALRGDPTGRHDNRPGVRNARRLSGRDVRGGSGHRRAWR